MKVRSGGDKGDKHWKGQLRFEKNESNNVNGTLK